MSNAMGQCPLCSAANPYTNQICQRCRATLPWSKALGGQQPLSAQQSFVRYAILLVVSMVLAVLFGLGFIFYMWRQDLAPPLPSALAPISAARHAPTPTSAK